MLDGGDIVIENSNNASSYITMEGIGNDAVANGWGIRIKNASNVEIRNIGLMLTNASEGDNIGLQQNNDYVWVHNCDLFYGAAGGDADQAKGDGAMDCKKSTYITFSYNHFWDSGKCNLLGLSEGTTSGLYITYHHNWYDHSDSRHPRIRYYSAHVYNNYYDGNSKYGAGSTLGSSVFMEGNFFRNCKYPMLTSKQGTDIFYSSEGTFSGEAGGTIKAFNNSMSGQTRYVPYNASSNPIEFDAVEVATRNETISSSIKSKLGANSYNNFDTNSSIMYTYTADSPSVAKDKVILYSGRVSGGDFDWTFNNEVDDTADAVNSPLMAALINYQSSLIAVQGESNPAGSQTLTSTPNNNQSVSAGVAINPIVYTWGGNATDATVTGLPASGISYVKNTTAKTITISGTPTATVSYSIATSGTAGSPASSSGTITLTSSGSQTLTSTSNNNQTVVYGTAISAITYTWGGNATDANVTGLPASGISFIKNTTAKTITISGTPTANTSYTITTVGTGTAATGSGSIVVTTEGTPTGNEIHNFTVSGKTSTFYAITGNINSADGLVNYNGLTLTKRLKIESSTSINFTTNNTSTLTLVFDNNFTGTIKINNVFHTATAGIVTASLPAGVNTITKGSTANLFYISTIYNAQSSVQTLTSTSNTSQTIPSGTAINPIVYTWGGDATDATVIGLPASGISFVKNTTAKTITISGTPTASVSYSISTLGTGTAATGEGTITVTIQTLTSTNNTNQTVPSGTAINSIVYTWGGDATDATVSGLPASGISFVKNTTAKTITISGTPTANVSFTVSTSGAGTAVSESGNITVTVNTPSDQIHNFTTSGKTSSFYAITGNINSTDGLVNYNGLTLTKRLKMESSTTVNFTTTNASTLTLVFDTNFTGTVKINNVSYTAVAGIVTASLPVGTFTITKGSVAQLYYISTEYNVASRNAQNMESVGNMANVENKLILFPNPVTDQLYLTSDAKVTNIKIYNMTGAIVKDLENNFETINLSNLSPGTYLVKIYTEKGTVSDKIISKQ